MPVVGRLGFLLVPPPVFVANELALIATVVSGLCVDDSYPHSPSFPPNRENFPQSSVRICAGPPVVRLSFPAHSGPSLRGTERAYPMDRPIPAMIHPRCGLHTQVASLREWRFVPSPARNHNPSPTNL